MRPLVFVVLVASCAADSLPADDLAGEDGDGADDGKTDDTGTFTYFQVAANGRSVSRPNKASTPCGDGVARAACAIDRIDYTGAALTADEVASATESKSLVVRGRLTGSVLYASELWIGSGTPRGVFVKVRDAAVTCATLACELRDELKLNSTRRARIGDLDIADDDSSQAAIGLDGLIVAGDRTTSGGVRGRTVTAAFTRVHGRKHWNVNDVSILFPIPEQGEDNLLLPMRDLWPEEQFEMLGDQAVGVPFLFEGPGRDTAYPTLRVTAARIDPCFDGKTPCERQVRLVAQPLRDGELFDASVHMFYKLDDAAFVRLLARVREAGVGGAGPAALGVHPKMAREGLRGPTATAFRAALAEACTVERLAKWTVMATGRSKNWFFSSFVRGPDGKFARALGETHEGSFSDHGTPAMRMPSPLMDPAFPDDMLATSSVTALDERTLLANIAKLERLANPELSRTAETRCASCHAAATTLDYALELRETALVPRTASTFAPVAYVPVATRNGFSNHHAFSYLGTRPTVSRRVINDSIVTVRMLSSTAFLSSLAPELRAQLQ